MTHCGWEFAGPHWLGVLFWVGVGIGVWGATLAAYVWLPQQGRARYWWLPAVVVGVPFLLEWRRTLSQLETGWPWVLGAVSSLATVVVVERRSRPPSGRAIVASPAWVKALRWTRVTTVTVCLSGFAAAAVSIAVLAQPRWC
ncbi:hypothetical protein [Nocardioides limicola]|uniref:hypothetical protein n=1 Tax=Nocardioides limicola TaxID=2803368 RepID=UPI00193C49C9|nr:hypothetical protein [Nocardioides sp. DJM-14]